MAELWNLLGTNISFETVSTFTKNIVIILAILGVGVDCAPWIKINPVRAILRWFGSVINTDIKNQIQALGCELVKMQKENDEKEVRRLRSQILSFANECRNKVSHTKDHFENICRDYSDYMEIIEKQNITNGFLESEYEYIKEVFHQCQIDNSFL